MLPDSFIDCVAAALVGVTGDNPMITLGTLGKRGQGRGFDGGGEPLEYAIVAVVSDRRSGWNRSLRGDDGWAVVDCRPGSIGRFDRQSYPSAESSSCVNQIEHCEKSSRTMH